MHYKNDKKDLAYYFLGRVVHLLEDASSIPHVHNDQHPDVFGLGFLNDDEYEAYMGRKSGDWDGNPDTGEVYTGDADGNGNVRGFDNNYVRWGWNNSGRTLAPVDYNHISEKILLEWFGSGRVHRGFDNTWPDWAFGHTNANFETAKTKFYEQPPLFRIFYSMAETTDDFPSDGFNGDDPIHDGDNNFGDVSEIKVIRYANVIQPAALEHIAGLYQLFWDETHPHPHPPEIISFSIDPNKGCDVADSSRQWLTLNGNWFLSASKVVLKNQSGTFPIPPDRTNFVSPTQIKVCAGFGPSLIGPFR